MECCYDNLLVYRNTSDSKDKQICGYVSFSLEFIVFGVQNMII